MYLVLSHTHPALVARLADRLLRGDEECEVVIDHQAGAPPLDPVLAADPRLHRRSSPRPGGWGGYGLVGAAFDAFVAIARDLDPDYVVMLSGQDYPVHPLVTVRERICDAGVDVHLSVLRRIADAGHGEDEERYWRARYFFRWWSSGMSLGREDSSLRRRWLSAEHRLSMAQRRLFVWTLPRGGGLRVGLRRPASQLPFSDDYPLWAGSQWLVLSRRAIAALQREAAANPAVVDLFRGSLIPDEAMLQTLLLNAAGLEWAEPNLTFQRAAGHGDAHAAELSLADLPEILASGRSFARKMHPHRSLELMDELDRRVAATA